MKINIDNYLEKFPFEGKGWSLTAEMAADVFLCIHDNGHQVLAVSDQHPMYLLQVPGQVGTLAKP